MYCVIGDLLYTSRSLTTAEFQWDEDNLRHTAPHKVTPELVGEIADNQPKLIVHSGQGRSGSHKMIGPDNQGEFWTIIVLELPNDAWRPITGWESTRSEIRIYYGLQ